jgi:hypothetical protein
LRYHKHHLQLLCVHRGYHGLASCI